MHIAFLTPEYPNKNFTRSGGLGTSIYNLAIALSKNGVRVSIIIPFQKETQKLRNNNIDIYAIKLKKFTAFNWYFYKKHLQRIINELCEKERIDCIEGPDWTGIGTFINFKVPYVVRLNGSDSYFCHIEQRKQRYKNYWLEKKNFQKAHAILSASDFTGVVTNQVFETSRQITTIYNSIDASVFKPSNDVVTRSNQILYFGTLIRKKGVLDLAHAINELVKTGQEIQVIFLGKDVIDYKEKRSTKRLIVDILSQEAEQVTTFLEEVPYNQVKSIIEESEVICLPSYAEAFPMTWLESMALSKAMVTSDIGWAKEMMIDGETGFVVQPSSHKLMAQRIIQLLDNSDLRSKMGAMARERILHVFSTDVIIHTNLDFYKNLLNR